MPPERTPASLDAQAALYRSLLAGKRMLIVLDNARDAHRSARCCRPARAAWCWSPAAASWPAWPPPTAPGSCRLDVLTRAEASQLLAARLGVARVAAEPAAVAELAELCARLPLALAIAAARAAARPGLPLAALAAELRDAAAGWTRWTPTTGGQRAGGVLLVLPAAQPRGGADVPAARRAPRPGHPVPAAASLAG